ncbi:MAG: hypothetical protein ACXWLG_13400 [Myxococcaceae bacterium]
MTARSVGAGLVDLALAAAIAALPAQVLAVGWSAGPLSDSGLPEVSVDGPSLAVRAILFLLGTAMVFALLRFTLERGGQGPGKCLFSLRVANGRVVEDGERLDLLERLGVFAGRFGRLLILALSCILVLVLWGGAMERSAIQAHQKQLLRRAYIYDAEYDCCSGFVDGRHDCARLLRIVAALADRTDGKGDIPPRESLLDRCPSARAFTRH